jgi:2-polyprenyl-3-methyl-5-hydroxy-6-metoxy-1,4-benzoquinol methylase
MNQSQSREYTDRLVRLQNSSWKRILDVQAPYRWNLKHLKMGRTLDIGCGIGRNLINLVNSVGIDPNISAVEIACSYGLTAYTPETFLTSPNYQRFSYDSLLLAHVAEHIGTDETILLLNQYLDLLKPNGKLVIITPQEAGLKSDATHIEFINYEKLRQINASLGLTERKAYSFPFPRMVGKFFRFNEFVFISHKKD